ncbi:RsmE family RNA methyltransferase [Gemmatimonadota bacterium]
MSGITCVLLTARDTRLEVGNEALLSPEESHHAVRVRRLQIGDEVWAINGGGTAFRCLLRDVDPEEARLEVLEIVPQWREPVLAVTLYQGVIRSNRLEQIVEQGTAIGMRRLVPLITSRVERHGVKMERFSRIAGETAKQCCRGRIPTIEESLSWQDFLSRDKEATLLVADAEADMGLIEYIRTEQGPPEDRIGIVIGPEGGLTEAELNDITFQGGIPVHLGRRRLRSESAAAAALTLLIIGAE